MTEEKSHKINMLEVLIRYAGHGALISLKGRPVREVVRLEREGEDISTVILSMDFTGMADDKPFRFKKEYSFADDIPQFALECLLIANNRLHMDLDRLKDAGIKADLEFFSFQNCFMGLPSVISAKAPALALRLEDFIHLSRAGVAVRVNVSLSRPSIESEEEGVKKKGFGCMAVFDFTIGAEKTTIEKLYGIGGYDDAKTDNEDVVEVANKRLERDCVRLKSAGMKVENPSFQHIWERVFDK